MPGHNLLIILEYKRLKLLKKKSFDILDNSDFKICKTYPETIIIPKGLTSEEIAEVSAFRSKGRIPCITWRHRKLNTYIIRCAQPCVGIQFKRSAADEKLISLCKSIGQEEIVIFDLRPKTNARVNILSGGGFEKDWFYKDVKIEFSYIENIHVVRNSLESLYDYCNTLSASPTTKLSDWQKALSNCKWLLYQRSILKCANQIIEIIRSKKSVIVHCSDGWDRTAQTVSIAQLLLDPYYRTLEGLLNLIEKDWIQFGHQFATRYGHSIKKLKDHKHTQRSPIFLQFIDLLFQLMQIYPQAFEWNEDLLLLIMEELYSCKYGTFLFDSTRERLKHNVDETTVSLWTVVLLNKEKYTNFSYLPSKRILYLDLANTPLQLWARYYLHYSEYPMEIFELIHKHDSHFSSHPVSLSDRHKFATMSYNNRAQVDSSIDQGADDLTESGSLSFSCSYNNLKSLE